MNLKELLGEAYREDMTLAEVEAAVNGLDLVDRNTATNGMVRKDVFDKTASDLAATKKKLKEKLTEEEQARLDREAHDKEIMNELEGLRRDKAVNQHVAQYMKLGYDPVLAQKTAEAMVSQDFEKVYEFQQQFLEARDKEIRRQITLSGDKRPPAGNANQGADYAKLAAEAGARGDFAAQAYYTRLSQENNE